MQLHTLSHVPQPRIQKGSFTDVDCTWRAAMCSQCEAFSLPMVQTAPGAGPACKHGKHGTPQAHKSCLPCGARAASAPADVLHGAPAAEDMQVRADGGHGVARAVVLAHQQAMHLPQRARIGLWLRCCPRARPVTPPPPAPMPPSPANALVQKPQLSPQQTPSTLSEP